MFNQAIQNRCMDMLTRIEHRLDEMRRTWVWLYKELGVSKQHASGWKRRRAIPTKHHEAIAQMLGVSLDWLAGRAGMVPAAKTPTQVGGSSSDLVTPEKISHTPSRAPVIGTLRMNSDHDCALDVLPAALGTVPSTGASRAYALRVRGDALHPVIRDGQFVLIDPDASPTAGEFVYLSLASGPAILCELLSLRADSVQIASPTTGARRTIEREDVVGLLAVVAIVAGSQFKP